MKRERLHIASEGTAVFAAGNMTLFSAFREISVITTTTTTTTTTPVGV